MVIVTRASIIAELREAKAIALEQRDMKVIKQANEGLRQVGAYETTEQEEREIALIVELDAIDTALYRHFDKDGGLLYVGISLSHLSRLIQHRERAHWYRQIETVKIQWFASRSEAIAAERHAIKTEKPIHNVTHNDARTN